MSSAPDNAGRSRPLVIAFLLGTILLLVLDLGSKWLAFENVAGTPVEMSMGSDEPVTIPAHDRITLIPKVLALKLTLNRGAAFGIGQGKRWIFIAAAVVAIAVIGHVFWHSSRRDLMLHVALALMLSGALGNVFDRVAYGQVRDLLWLFPGVKLPLGWTWGGGNDDLYPWIFNIADAAMCIALGMLLLGGLIGWRRKKKQTRTTA